MSTQQVKSKETVLRELTARRNDEPKGKMRVSFREELEFSNRTPLKQKIGMAVMNWSNFPYENSRRLNNNTIDMEEADSLKNKLDSLSKEAHVLHNALSNIKESNIECRGTFFHFCKTMEEELIAFNQSFEDSLKQCYSSLSSMRRETNE